MSCPLSYTLSITGDCSNTSQGAVTFNITGTAPTYTITSPNSGTTSGIISAYTETNLSAGTYNYVLSDSCLPSNSTLPITVYISSGTCVSITDIENTTCGINNGILTAETTSQYGNVTFYLYDSTGLKQTIVSAQNNYVFNSLSPETYYVIADDGGGCSGSSQSCIIKSSTTLDYGFFIVNDSGCFENTGKIFITGLTGTPPFTYSWSNGATTSSITGLTTGPYSVTVIDDNGCLLQQGAFVQQVPPPTLVTFLVNPPSCYAFDGEVTMIINGGTPPYYYSGSNGDIQISLSDSVTFTGISAGLFSVYVVDAGLCTLTQSTIVSVPASFNVFSVTITNSNCNNLSGAISVGLLGGTPPYTYTLTDSLSNSTSETTSSPTKIFNGLTSGTYSLTITDAANVCSFTSAYTITNNVKFTLSATTTGTTCNQDDGSILLQISNGGTAPFTYNINGGSTIVTASLSQLFTNLPSGNYTATVTDSDFCIQNISINIPSSPTVDFTLFGIDPILGYDGIVEALITDGEPPFTLNWSPNVNGQLGLTVTSLTAGTYTLTVTDNNGCIQTRSITLFGYLPINGTGLINYCDKNFVQTTNQLVKGPKQLLLEGFNDLTSGFTNCVLNQAIFEAVVEFSGNTYIVPFYTGTSYNDVPTYTLWGDTIKNILLSIDGIGEVNIDINNNKISVSTSCESQTTLNDVTFIVDMSIQYDISCVSCAITTTTSTSPSTTTTTTISCLNENCQSYELENLSSFNSAGFQIQGCGSWEFRREYNNLIPLDVVNLAPVGQGPSTLVVCSSIEPINGGNANKTLLGDCTCEPILPTGHTFTQPQNTTAFGGRFFIHEQFCETVDNLQFTFRSQVPGTLFGTPKRIQIITGGTEVYNGIVTGGTIIYDSLFFGQDLNLVDPSFFINDLTGQTTIPAYVYIGDDGNRGLGTASFLVAPRYRVCDNWPNLSVCSWDYLINSMNILTEMNVNYTASDVDTNQSSSPNVNGEIIFTLNKGALCNDFWIVIDSLAASENNDIGFELIIDVV